MTAPSRKTLMGLRGMVSTGRMSAPKKVNGHGPKVFRQVCKVCAKMFDPAISDIDAPITVSLCTDCREKLTQGYTACVTLNPPAYAFLKHDHLKQHGLAGQIVQMSRENYDAVKKRYEDGNKTENSDQA